MSETKLPAVKVQECIGALEHAKEIVKISEAVSIKQNLEMSILMHYVY